MIPQNVGIYMEGRKASEDNDSDPKRCSNPYPGKIPGISAR